MGEDAAYPGVARPAAALVPMGAACVREGPDEAPTGNHLSRGLGATLCRQTSDSVPREPYQSRARRRSPRSLPSFLADPAIHPTGCSLTGATTMTCTAAC